MAVLLHILLGASRGGCEGNAHCLIQGTPQLRHHVLVLGNPGPMSVEFEKAGASVEHAGLTETKSRSVISAVRNTVQKTGASAVIVWHGMVCLPEILHALHDFKGRVLVHGGNPAHSLPRWVDLRYILREWRLGKRCDATYVCCSQYVADSFEQSYYLRRFSRVVVPNGVKPLTVPPHQPREIRPGGPFTIGMTARLDHIKDHPTLLRAFALVRKEWPSARLELAGDGARRAELEQLTRELEIADGVRFLGMVGDVYSVMQHWDIFAYATTEREGLGNALTEAMMLGLPCVATKTGPIVEVAGRPASAALVDARRADQFADTLKSLIRSQHHRWKLSALARDHARQNFATDVYARAYIVRLFS